MNFVRSLFGHTQILSFMFVGMSLVYYLLGKTSWHYYPIYFLGLFHLFILIFQKLHFLRITTFIVIVTIGLSILLPIVSHLSLSAFAEGKLPLPTGSYAIGTKVYEIEDEGRGEIYGPEEISIRKIKYQLWYPAATVTASKRAKWLKDGTLLPRTLVKNALMPLPTFILDQAANIYSHAYYDASLSSAEEKYPVVIISHGWKSFSELHTDFAEDLASHGYFVLTIDHTYGAQAVQFADGTVAYLDKKALPRIATPSEFSKTAHQLAINYGQDIVMVLDEIERLNQMEEPFKDRFDLERIGHLGHSTGGAGGVYVGLQDVRLKALVGLDAWVNPLDAQTLTTGLSIPALFMRSQQWRTRQSKKPLHELIQHSDQAKLLELKEAHHIDYPLLYVFSPYLSKVGLTSSQAGEEFSTMQREFVRTFFDAQLKDGNFDDKVIKRLIDTYEIVHFGNINK